MPILIILGILSVFVIIFLKKGFVIIKQAKTMVIDRLGKYYSTFDSGVNFIWLILDKAREIEWSYIQEDMSRGKIIRK